MSRYRKRTSDPEVIAAGAQEDMMSALREKQCLALRLRGKTFAAIAHETGYANPSVAQKAYRRALYKVVAADDVVLEVRTQAARLEELQEAVYDQARGLNGKKQSHFAIDRELAIMERRAKLLGLDRDRKTDGVTAAQVVTVAYPPEWLAAMGVGGNAPALASVSADGEGA